MKILYKIRPIEVKRTFVISQKIRFSRGKSKKFQTKLSKEFFLKKLKQAKTAVKKFSENQLDKIIAQKHPKRARAYNKVEWYRAKVSTSEVGVWRRAGSLPAAWTCPSLAQTALKVKRGLEQNSHLIRARARRAIPAIMSLASIISKEKYFFPIIFMGGAGTRGRKRCGTKTKGDVDDGCMRSIAFAVLGYKELNVYLGKPKN